MQRERRHGSSSCSTRLCGLLVGALVGCASVGAVERTVGATTEASATIPRARIMQFAGTYYGDANSTSFDSIELRRDGTFAAVVDGVHRRGRYEEQLDAGAPTVALSFPGETVRVAFAAAWGARQQLSVVRGGVAETLSATTAGTEEVCEASGGAWRDDDAEPATGLYCTCLPGNVFVPSLGGCTDE